MRKHEDQVMSSWISDVKNAAFHLESAGVAIIDEDVILALTAGLPESYSSFIVTRDNLPSAELTLTNIITRLLKQNRTSFSYNDQAFGAMMAKNKKNKTPLNEITCYNCSGKGHYKTNCPSPEQSALAVLGSAEDVEDKIILFYLFVPSTLHRSRRCVGNRASGVIVDVTQCVTVGKFSFIYNCICSALHALVPRAI
jgi:hypothetical protein